MSRPIEQPTAASRPRPGISFQPLRSRQRGCIAGPPGRRPGHAVRVHAPGCGDRGPDPRQYFPTAAHLASWAGLCPGNHESAGKRRHGKRRHGNIYLQPVLVEIAWSAARHDGYLKSLYHRHVTRNGAHRNPVTKGKAITTVAHAILVIIWNILATGCPYQDLGAGYSDRRTDPDREPARLIARLEALGKHVTVNDAA